MRRIIIIIIIIITIMAPWALPRCQYAVNLAVARGTANMQSFGLAAISVAPSDDLESEHFFQKNL